MTPGAQTWHYGLVARWWAELCAGYDHREPTAADDVVVFAARKPAAR